MSEDQIQLIQSRLSDIKAPIQVLYSPNKGRYATANRAMYSGEAFLQLKPYGTSINMHIKSRICYHCFYYSGKKLPYSCENCKDIYICEKCKNSTQSYHSMFECLAFQNLQRYGGSFTSHENMEIKLIVQLLCLQNQEVNRETINTEIDSKQCKFDDIMLIGDHVNEIIHEKFELKATKQLVRCIAKILHFSLMENVSEDLILRLISKERCNVFGIWEKNKYDHCIGLALYPLASFFNHSCAPNVIRLQQGEMIMFKTLREIQLGEELNIAYYIHLNDCSVHNRKSILKDMYKFECRCERCNRSANSLFNEQEFLSTYVCPVSKCSKGLLVPHINATGVVDTRICQVCGFRKSV